MYVWCCTPPHPSPSLEMESCITVKPKKESVKYDQFPPLMHFLLILKLRKFKYDIFFYLKSILDEKDNMMEN